MSFLRALKRGASGADQTPGGRCCFSHSQTAAWLCHGILHMPRYLPGGILGNIAPAR